MSQHPHGTVTFLFTDIERSTRLWQRHPEAMMVASARHDALLRQAATSQGGVVYKVIGDALQVAFPTAPQAVTAALEAQRALTGEDWAAHGLAEPLRVRMALHTGAVDPGPDGDYRSPVLNRLGRLLGAGHGRQVLLSLATQELARDHLPAEVSLHDLGEHRLKDLFRAERVYQLAGRGIPDVFPPLRTLDTRPNNLPLQPTPFIGREQEVGDARTVLAHPDVRLLTLTGPGGMGKTRLGFQIAADLLDLHADGVFVVELAALTDPALVPSAVGTVLGVQEEAGTTMNDQIRTFLADKQLLLVLDNFEQILEAASLVGEWLGTCPGLTILVTSRVRLGLRGEREYPVPPLALPDLRRLPSLDQMAQYDAVRLFVERAVEAQPAFAVTNANAPAVAGICHRLDGLPLAIELAAARIRMLPPQAMLARLQSRLPLLTGGARDLPERQRTLRGAIAWSYDLLTSDEQALFRRLSVFAGGFTLEAAEVVAAGDELGLELFDGLERLVEHSLVRQTETAGEPRFMMLETIREYGLEQLATSGEADEAHQRHAAWVVNLADQEGGPGQGAWLARLGTEYDNLRAALSWLLVHQPEAALRLVGSVWRFWTMRGHFREGQAWVEQVLATVPARSPEWARVLYGAATLAIHLGDLVRAEACGQELLAIGRELDDPDLIGMGLLAMGNVAMVEGDPERAILLSGEALALARANGNKERTTVSSINVGILMAQQGDFERAAALMEESLHLSRELGNLNWMIYGLVNLGQLALAQGAWTDATTLFREGLQLVDTLGMQDGIVAEALIGVGIIAGVRGDHAQAARLFGAADALLARLGTALDPVLPEAFARAMAVTPDALGEELYAAYHAAGAALPSEDAVAEALVITNA